MSAPMKKSKPARRATTIPNNKKGTGVRYSEEKKKMVLAWYKARMRHNPRGAITETCKHFNVSYAAIMLWLKNTNGGKAPGNGMAIRAIHTAMKASQKQMKVYESILKSLN